MSPAIIILATAVGSLLAALLRGLLTDELKHLLRRTTQRRLDRAIESVPLEMQRTWAERWRADFAALATLPFTAFRFELGVRRMPGTVEGATASVERTIAALPSHLQEAWAEEWRAELASVVSDPLMAARLARGIRRSARALATPALAYATPEIPLSHRFRVRLPAGTRARSPREPGEMVRARAALAQSLASTRRLAGAPPRRVARAVALLAVPLACSIAWPPIVRYVVGVATVVAALLGMFQIVNSLYRVLLGHWRVGALRRMLILELAVGGVAMLAVAAVEIAVDPTPLVLLTLSMCLLLIVLVYDLVELGITRTLESAGYSPGTSVLRGQPLAILGSTRSVGEWSHSSDTLLARLASICLRDAAPGQLSVAHRAILAIMVSNVLVLGSLGFGLLSGEAHRASSPPAPAKSRDAGRPLRASPVVLTRRSAYDAVCARSLAPGMARSSTASTASSLRSTGATTSGCPGSIRHPSRPRLGGR